MGSSQLEQSPWNRLLLSRTQDGSASSVDGVCKLGGPCKMASGAAYQKLRALVEAFPFPVVAINTEFQVELWNRAAEETFGWAADEVRGKPAPTVRPGREPYFRDSMALVFSGQAIELPDVLAQHKRGELVPVSLHAAPVFDTEGHIVQAIAVIEDISERKRVQRERERAAAELKRLEKSRILLLRRLIKAQEEERRWIARELHDHAGQSMLAVSLGLKGIEHAGSPEQMHEAAEQLRKICADTLKELSQLARGLHPSVVDDLGLVPAIERYCADYSKTFGIEVAIHQRHKQEAKAAPDVAIAVYRIVQEALTNIRKHASATRVEVTLKFALSGLEVCVLDNGRGFAAGKGYRAGHLGIAGMRERAEAVGGTFSLTSSKKLGTKLTVVAPVETEKCRTKKSRS